MKSPEQQPTPQPEKSPANVGLDIDAAKKYLEKVYGGEKSSAIIDQSIPISAKQEKESEKKPAVEEVKPSLEKEVSKEVEKKEPTVEEKLAEKEKIRVAKDELIDLAKSIKEAREKQEKEKEMSFYGKAKEVYETATGGSLEKIAGEKAKVEIEAEGLKFFNTPQEYRKEKTVETQDRIRQKERSAVIKERWNMLSDKEKGEYFGEGKNKNNPADIDSARSKFAVELNKKIDAKRQELSKGKNGITISEDVFYELMKKGLKSEDIKKRGIFGRMFGGEIEIPPLDKRGYLEPTRNDLTAMEITAKKNIEEAAQEEIERKIIEGQRAFRGRKQRHTREIIQETAVKYEAEKKLEVKPEPQKPKIEIISRVGRERTPEHMKEMEKIRQQVETDIEKRKESKKKIEELIKKQKKGELLTAKEVAYLRTIEFGQKTEKELKKAT